MKKKIIIKKNKSKRDKMDGKNVKMDGENVKMNILNYDKILRSMDNFNPIIKDTGVLVVMCVWKRIKNLQNTIRYLDDQDEIINLFIFNNSKEKDILNKNNIKFSKSSNSINIFNSNENIGGIGRFFMVRKLLDIGLNYKKVIFIDDDQILKKGFITFLLNNYKEKTSVHYFGRVFVNGEYRNSIDSRKCDKFLNLDYGGTGGMIIGTEIFKINDILKIPVKYQFVEDLWLSYNEIIFGYHKIYYPEIRKFILMDSDYSKDKNSTYKKLWFKKEKFIKEYNLV